MTARNNDDLARQLSRDIARLSTGPSQRPEPGAASLSERPVARSAAAVTPPPPAPPPAPPELSQLERRGLYVALAAGTRRNLGREPTATELAELVKTVSEARQVATWEKAILRGAEVHWAGSAWSFEAAPSDSHQYASRVA
jgi:hypothetical protein